MFLDKLNFIKLNQCPQFRAFIHESMRLHGVGIISPARSCMKDTYINHKEKEYLIKYFIQTSFSRLRIHKVHKHRVMLYAVYIPKYIIHTPVLLPIVKCIVH